MDDIIEFENERTGKTRKFPRIFFDALVAMNLQCFPKDQQERVEEQVGLMVGDFLDNDPRAEPLLLAAELLYPEIRNEDPV